MPDIVDMRTTYCEVMGELMRENRKIVALEADLMSALGSRCLQNAFPDRFVNAGVAEANMIGVAAGMSTFGKIPVAHTFASFATRRCYDQICVSVCYAKQNVKIVGTDPGVASEHNGGTHMALEDVGLMRSLAGMTIVEPCDNEQLRQTLPAIVHMYGPVYLRLYRRAPYPVYDSSYRFVLGKADVVREGGDLTVIASGLMMGNALEAAKSLAEKGIKARVVNMHTIKPLDAESVVRAARETGAIVTAENNNYLTGLGSAVAETLCENGVAVPFRRIGVRDHFGEVGRRDYLMEKFHLAPRDIVQAAEEVLSLKKKGKA